MAIVCGTDFSEQGLEAVKVAAALARRWGEPLLLLHAMDLDAGGLYGLGRQPLMEAARRAMDRQVSELVSPEVQVERLLLIGAADELLAAAARERGARLVVISFLGRRSGGGFRLGSTADRLARTSPSPLLVVRRSEPLAAWTRGERPLRMVVGADFSAATEPAVSLARQLCQQGTCQLTFLHSYGPFTEHHRMLLPPSPRVMDGDPLVERSLEEDLTKRLGGLRPGERVRAAVNPGGSRIGDHLCAVAAQEKADLVVVGTHRRRGLDAVWHGSVARRVLETAEGAVLVVPRGEAETGHVPARLERVVVPTDFSPEGDAAIGYAAAILPDNASLVLLHVTTEGAALPQAEARSLREALEARVPPDLRARGIRVRVELAGGVDVAEGICDAADRFGADAIFLASHGRSGVRRLLAGSVAAAVMARCDRAVILVRPPR